MGGYVCAQTCHLGDYSLMQGEGGDDVYLFVKEQTVEIKRPPTRQAEMSWVIQGVILTISAVDPI